MHEIQRCGSVTSWTKQKLNKWWARVWRRADCGEMKDPLNKITVLDLSIYTMYYRLYWWSVGVIMVWYGQLKSCDVPGKTNLSRWTSWSWSHCCHGQSLTKKLSFSSCFCLHPFWPSSLSFPWSWSGLFVAHRFLLPRKGSSWHGQQFLQFHRDPRSSTGESPGHKPHQKVWVGLTMICYKNQLGDQLVYHRSFCLNLCHIELYNRMYLYVNKI